MKNIKIKSIKLVNFKGVRSFECDFNQDTTTICGKNGSGKTTIFDAFTWLLFGKNSEDAKSFNIKTLDSDNKVIEKIPHEVSAVLDVDGESVTLTRRYTEKWQKKRGSSEEEFTGHDEERLYNNVPCKVSEFTSKIESICPEQTFKMITNPAYFTSQKKDVQRSMLFGMAGGVKDEDIAKGNKEFESLLLQLTGKTLEEFKKEINANKRRIKAELDGIPERIDERKRTSPDAEDWSSLEKQRQEALDSIAEIDAQIMDAGKRMESVNEKRKSMYQTISDLNQSMAKRKSEIENRILEDYYKNESTKSEMINELNDNKRKIENAQGILDHDIKAVEVLKGKVVATRQRWKDENAKQLTFSEDEFVCPTCKRPLDIEDIEAKQSEMQANFNAKKAEILAEISKEGKQYNKDIETLEERISVSKAFIADKTTDVEFITKKLSEFKNEKPDTSSVLDADPEYNSMKKKADDLSDQISKLSTDAPDTSTMQAKKNELQNVVNALTARLSAKGVIEANNKRIAELETQMKSQSTELARLEGMEFTIQQFGKAKIEAVEGKINSLFDNVKFKLFETQINGGEVETCEAMVNGVPFSDLNNAGRINAGLDIINAICRSNGITAPVIVDNAEAINKVMDINSQMILLKVTEDEKLIIK